MNKAITQGLVLMPPPFSAGLGLWSREDGRPGQGSYAGQPNAGFVPADQDFAGCLELQKTAATQKLRSFQQIPFQSGLYVRVTARVKLTQPIDVAALSGLTSFGQRRVLAPKGSGHSIAGLSVTGNVFRNGTGAIDRVEMVDTTHATLSAGNYRNLVFANNTFNGITQATVSPILVEHTQNTADETWVVDAGDYLPFGARARNVESHVLEGPVRNAGGTVQWVQPYVEVEQGAGNRLVNLRWPSAVRGKAMVKVRCDNPL
jgi:hypothetical protein